MYTILLNDDNKLVTSVRERIMQRSKLVDNLHFLVEPIYKGEHDMSEFTVMMEYILPVSREYHSELLVKSEGLYKDKLEYKVPFDTCLTKEAGDVELQLTFVKVNKDDASQHVRKTSTTVITVLPISAWSDIIPDGALTALDQRLIMAENLLYAANDMADYLSITKADNIKYNEETNEVQLLSGETAIGDKVILKTNNANLEDGLPVVEFSTIPIDPPDEEDDSNVVEF